MFHTIAIATRCKQQLQHVFIVVSRQTLKMSAYSNGMPPGDACVEIEKRFAADGHAEERVKAAGNNCVNCTIFSPLENSNDTLTTHAWSYTCTGAHYVGEQNHHDMYYDTSDNQICLSDT